MMREWERARRRRDSAKRAFGNLAAYLATGVVLTMPMWMILLRLI